MRRAIGTKAKGHGERSRIAFVRLHASRARGIPGGIIRISDYDLLPERLETVRHPFALCTVSSKIRGGARFPNRSRLVRILLGDPTVRRERAQLALAFVKIDSYHIHGWPPGGCPPRQTMSTLI